MRSLVVLNLAMTMYMVGLIWMVQMVHYPLMNRVPAERFTDYERDHQRLTTLVVLPPMMLELVTAVALVVWPPKPEWTWLLWTGLILLGIVWLTTFTLSVPCHKLLSEQFDAAVHARLVQTNWIRTVGWSARGVIMCCVTYSLIARST